MKQKHNGFLRAVLVMLLALAVLGTGFAGASAMYDEIGYAGEGIDETQAIEVARAALAEAFGQSEDEAAAVVYRATYRRNSETGNAVWFVSTPLPTVDAVGGFQGYALVTPEGGITEDADIGWLSPQRQAEDAAKFSVLADRLRDGEPQVLWSIEERAEMLDGHGLPAATDISREKAQALALAALEGNGVTEAADMDCYDYFIIEDAFLQAPYWQIMYMRGMDLQYTVYLSAASGGVLRIEMPGEGNG